MKHLYLIPAVVIFLVSCAKEPDPSFSVSSTEVEAGEVVTFQNTSEDAESYSWDFGDGTTSAEDEPDHVYEEKGIYVVRLTAYSKKEKKSASTGQSIEVRNPVASITGTYVVTATETSSCPDNTMTYAFTIREHPNPDSVFLDNFAGRFDNVLASYDKNDRMITNRVTSGADDGNGGKYEIYIGNNTVSKDGSGIAIGYSLFNYEGGGNCGLISGSGTGVRK